MGDASVYLVDGFINALLNRGAASGFFGAFASPPPLHLVLCTAAPTAGDNLAALTEVAYVGYAREALTEDLFDAAINTVGGSRGVSNDTAIDFPDATATYSSPSITHFAIVDVTAGEVLYADSLGTVIGSLEIGQAPSFPIGSLRIQKGLIS